MLNTSNFLKIKSLQEGSLKKKKTENSDLVYSVYIFVRHYKKSKTINKTIIMKTLNYKFILFKDFISS